MGNQQNRNKRPTRAERRSAKATLTAFEQGLGDGFESNPQPRKERGSKPSKPAKPSSHAVMVGIKLDLTKSQKTVGNLIKSRDLLFIQGAAGAGKTMGILAEFVNQYLADSNKQLIVIRTPVEAGADKIGFLPNGLNDKIEPHFASAKDALNLLLGAGKVETDMNHRIHFKIPNYCLGSTWDNALVLIDEAQQIQPMIMKLLLERAGKNTKIVVAGDPTQLYVNDTTRNGLSNARSKFIDTDGVPFYPTVDWFDFPLEDSKTRSELAFTVVHAYNTKR
ncbi:PhoH-like protein [compost metagenome]